MAAEEGHRWSCERVLVNVINKFDINSLSFHSYVRYVGIVTILVNDYPKFKV